jgi:hypothetical protein
MIKIPDNLTTEELLKLNDKIPIEQWEDWLATE